MRLLKDKCLRQVLFLGVFLREEEADDFRLVIGERQLPYKSCSQFSASSYMDSNLSALTA
jgi:hypothetical protein